jgi:hypothetical protein
MHTPYARINCDSPACGQRSHLATLRQPGVCMLQWHPHMADTQATGPVMSTLCCCCRQRWQQRRALHLADGCGEALGDAVRDAVAAGSAAIAAAAAAPAATGREHGGQEATDAAAAAHTQAAVLWVQLRLLPHACAGPLEVCATCTLRASTFKGMLSMSYVCCMLRGGRGLCTLPCGTHAVELCSAGCG